MRADMGKVLVEAPRSGRASARAVAGSRRQDRNRVDRDGEAAPVRLGMKRDRHACKHFGEHLGPLYRYLRQQLNRPWAKIHGELCAALDQRSVVQAHLFQHLRDKVDTETEWREDGVWVRNWRGLVPLAESRVEMYVHPRTGLLLLNRARAIADGKRKQAQQEQALARERQRRIGSKQLPADTQWHRVDGLWYALQLRRLDGAAPETLPFDVLLRRAVGAADSQLLLERYGSGSLYAHAKRQLDGKTVRRNGLAAD